MATRERTLGKDHPDTLRSSHYLAESLRAQGRYTEAEAAYHTVIEARTRVLGPEHPDTLNSRVMLAIVLANQARYAEAEAENRDLITIDERLFGPDNPVTLVPVYNMAICLSNQGMIDDGRSFTKRAYEGRTRTLGAAHYDTKQAERLYANLEGKK